MKNKMILIIVLFISLFTAFGEVKVYGEESGDSPGGGGASSLIDPLKFPDTYKPTEGKDSEDKITTKAGVILGAINTIGVVVSVIVLMVIGIKYMIGSVEEKAEYKKTMLGYFIGAILLFGTTTIVNIFYQIATNF